MCEGGQQIGDLSLPLLDGTPRRYRVAVMRRRIAASTSSGTLTRNGRMLGGSVVVLVPATGTSSTRYVSILHPGGRSPHHPCRVMCAIVDAMALRPVLLDGMMGFGDSRC
jgi:hypothetical protein